MSALSDRIAAEHAGRRTSMTGTQCVCGTNVQPGMWSAHLADVTERAVRDTIVAELEAMPLGTHIDRVSGRTMAHAVRTEAARIAREGTTP